MEKPLYKDIGFHLCVIAGLVVMFGAPRYFDIFEVYTYISYVVLAIYALSLAYIWGFGGILSFGQSAFFGLGGYTFAVASINMGTTGFPFLLAFAIPALFGAAVGYFMFYGRLSDVYMGVVTLVVALILFKLINHTAGPEYSIGSARLGGFNGIPSIPTLALPGVYGGVELLDPGQMFTVYMGILLIVYVGLRLLLASDFGRVSVSVRENEMRSSLLGYDVRRHKVIVFALGAGIAGMAGAMWATYQTFIDPNAFSLERSAQALIWVMAGGVGTLIGPILGAVGLQWLSITLGEMQLINNLVLLGVILIFLVLILPKGIVPSIRMWSLDLFTVMRRQREGLDPRTGEAPPPASSSQPAE